jgi:hypothetical protein
MTAPSNHRTTFEGQNSPTRGILAFHFYLPEVAAVGEAMK